MMNFNTPRCKAYSFGIEAALWAVLCAAIAFLWGFSFYKFLEAL